MNLPYELHRGDCREVMATMATDSVDAVVTDPPYGLSFMGREWDHGVPGVPFWAEALRVAKPGAHLVAFGGSRTFHRLTCAVEDAGWEVRDVLMWLYGSGFPKSLDVSKAIDKDRDDGADIRRVTSWLAAERDAAGLTNRQIDDAFGFNGMAGHWTNRTGPQAAVPKWEQWQQLKAMIGFGCEMDAEVWRLNGRKGAPGESWSLRPITQAAARPLDPGDVISFDQRSSSERERRDIPATDAASQWSGWGTALKPAYEPIILARKPLRGTVARNVQAYGTGAVNVDGCRIPHASTDDLTTSMSMSKNPWRGDTVTSDAYGGGRPQQSVNTNGRWPANVLLDETAATALDAQSGDLQSPSTYTRSAHAEGEWLHAKPAGSVQFGHGDRGGASRFFYTSKASGEDRARWAGNDHPTVKPTDLMRWLCRLVTPPRGLILDPFMGSGSTGVAAVEEGFRFVGIDLEEHHVDIARRRLAHGARQPGLFD